MANVSREQKEITKARILKAASRLFAKQGFTATTVSQIAKVAEVSESSIFTYFISKDDLLARIVLPEGSHVDATAEYSTPWQAVTAITRLHFEPFVDLDKRLLCEYQAAINRATPFPNSRIIQATAQRDSKFVACLGQVLETFQVESLPIVMEIVIAIVLSAFQNYMTQPEFGFERFLAQVEEQVGFLLKRQSQQRLADPEIVKVVLAR